MASRSSVGRPAIEATADDVASVDDLVVSAPASTLASADSSHEPVIGDAHGALVRRWEDPLCPESNPDFTRGQNEVAAAAASRAARNAVARPIPLPAPVISVRLPSSLSIAMPPMFVDPAAKSVAAHGSVLRASGGMAQSAVRWGRRAHAKVVDTARSGIARD
jgi:hypothetical protein